MRISGITAAVILVLAPALAAAQQVRTTVTSNEIAQLLTAAGFDPEMSTSGDGTPAAKVRAKGYVFHVRGRRCLVTSCETLLFFANFDMDREMRAQDYRIINGFNDSSLDGRAYVLPQDRRIGVDMVVDLRGGLTPEYMRLKAESFPGVIQAFVDYYKKKSGN